MFHFEENKIYTMPPFFGGTNYNPNLEVTAHNFFQITITHTTDENRLMEYIPQCYKLLRPEITIGFAHFGACDFLAGASYNGLQVTVPVRFEGRRDNLDGDLNLVIWENKAVPIIGGREEDGMPKLPAEIEDLHSIQNNYFTTLSYEGNTFLQINMENPQPVYGQSLNQIKEAAVTINALGWRYIPKLGGPGAEISQPTLYPMSYAINNAWMGPGTFKWTKLMYQQNERQYHIINALADLPVKDISPATMSSGIFTLMPYKGRVLE